jgi:hypothetical protein
MNDIEKFAGDYGDKIPSVTVSSEEIPGSHLPGQGNESTTLPTEAPDGIGLPDTVVFPVLSGSVNKHEPPKPLKGMSPTAGVPPVLPMGKKPAVTLVAMVLVLIVVFGAAAIIVLSSSGNPNSPNYPAITPNATSSPVTMAIPTSVIIPPHGVWVKVTYNGTFVGSYGNPGPANQQEVRGTGEQIYAIRDSNDTVQATFTKQDYSGNILTVEVYNNGTRVTQVSKSSPKAEIDILVNPKTGAPYAPVTTTSV